MRLINALYKPRSLALAAALVLAGSLFLPWYGFESRGAGQLAIHLRVVSTLSAWEAFSVVDVAVAACAAVIVVSLIIGRSPSALSRARTRDYASAGAALLALALAAFRILDPPGTGLGVRAGAFVALGAALAILLSLERMLLAAGLVPRQELRRVFIRRT